MERVRRKKEGDSSLISTGVRVIYSRRTPEKSRPQQDRERVVRWDFATTGPRTPKNAVNHQWHRSLHQNRGGDQRGVSKEGCGVPVGVSPDYLPNLNLIERLWRFLRKEASQRWHETFESMKSAVAGVLDHLERYRKEVRSLMSERFRLVPEQPTSVIV